MPINPAEALAAKFPSAETSYEVDDVILYHLGIGAGVPQTDANELEYTYEKNLKVLPSFGVIPTFGAMGGSLFNTPGLKFNPAMLLHGEQDIEIHRPLPTSAKLVNESRIAALYDKGKAALVVFEVKTSEKGGAPLFTNRFSLFLRGEGGFGGDSGPKVGNDAPQRAPDLVVESKTLPQQALLYRLSGDKNPLHADPGFAKMGGFDVPILHGLCSFGIVCKAAVDKALGGDVTKVARYQARFAGVFFPGETMVTSIWKEGARLLVSSISKERGTPVVSNAAVELRG
ncbi:MAG: MaoC family dehydratase N-terminal domain-containing protein [Deltaproteobacteria bacterium]|nr:MaoC family dehydratase N-terminal domain-containing protein [Deltaproteobacteria bacterium]